MRTNHRMFVNWEIIALMTVLLAGPVSAATNTQDWLYRAQPGDSIWGLSERYLVSTHLWPKLQALNHVTAPQQIPPGTVIRLPFAWLKSDPAKVEVVYVQGQVQALTGDSGQAKPAQAGMSLSSGDAIRTGPGSNASLKFFDGSQMLVQSDSHLLTSQQLRRQIGNFRE